MSFLRSGGSAVDGASVFVDLGSRAASLHTLDSHSGNASGSADWQASSNSGVVDGLVCQHALVTR